MTRKDAVDFWAMTTNPSSSVAHAYKDGAAICGSPLLASLTRWETPGFNVCMKCRAIWDALPQGEEVTTQNCASNLLEDVEAFASALIRHQLLDFDAWHDAENYDGGFEQDRVREFFNELTKTACNEPLKVHSEGPQGNDAAR
jgi:hypothetical protein